jgi:hypothetical protein
MNHWVVIYCNTVSLKLNWYLSYDYQNCCSCYSYLFSVWRLVPMSMTWIFKFCLCNNFIVTFIVQIIIIFALRCVLASAFLVCVCTTNLKRKFGEICGGGGLSIICLLHLYRPLCAVIYFNKAIYELWQFDIFNQQFKQKKQLRCLILNIFGVGILNRNYLLIKLNNLYGYYYILLKLN